MITHAHFKHVYYCTAYFLCVRNVLCVRQNTEKLFSVVTIYFPILSMEDKFAKVNSRLLSRFIILLPCYDESQNITINALNLFC